MLAEMEVLMRAVVVERVLLDKIILLALGAMAA
jgi:hypothetical protein